MAKQQQCIQRNIVNKFQIVIGTMNQIYKIVIIGQLEHIYYVIVSNYHQKNGGLIQPYKII